MAKFYLTLMASGLALVSLTYGISPGTTVPTLFDIQTSTIDIQHVFRGITGLYFGLAAFWFIASRNVEWYKPAITSVILFMLGMGFGRLASILLDGTPSIMLVAYMVIEFGAAALGLYAMKNPIAEQSDFLMVDDEDYVIHWSAVDFDKNLPNMNLFAE